MPFTQGWANVCQRQTTPVNPTIAVLDLKRQHHFSEVYIVLRRGFWRMSKVTIYDSQLCHVFNRIHAGFRRWAGLKCPSPSIGWLSVTKSTVFCEAAFVVWCGWICLMSEESAWIQSLLLIEGKRKNVGRWVIGVRQINRFYVSKNLFWFVAR